MITKHLMRSPHRKVLYNKYKILSHIQFKAFDKDFKILEDHLLALKKDRFDANERIIIEHQDTDYYLPDFPYGIGLYNLFTAFKKTDIPLFTMLLFTNHFGIKKEVQALAPDQNNTPTVIESFIVRSHYTNEYDHVTLDSDQIHRPAVCMMGQARVHRWAMYHFLANRNLLPLVATSIQGTT